MEMRPCGSEPQQGLLLAQKCYAPKRPSQEQAQELPGRPPCPLVTPQLGNSMLSAMLLAGWD